MKHQEQIINDNLLVNQALDGQTQAWDQLYEQSKAVVFGFAVNYMRNFQMDTFSAEDICAEAYYRAFKKLSAFQGRSMFSSWVCGIVKRVIWEENRKYYKGERIRSACCAAFTTLNSRDPGDICVAMELSYSLWKALEALHPLESYLLENHVIHDYTLRQLSKTAQLSYPSAVKRYHHGRERFALNFHLFYHNRRLARQEEMCM